MRARVAASIDVTVEWNPPSAGGGSTSSVGRWRSTSCGGVGSTSGSPSEPIGKGRAPSTHGCVGLVVDAGAWVDVVVVAGADVVVVDVDDDEGAAAWTPAEPHAAAETTTATTSSERTTATHWPGLPRHARATGPRRAGVRYPPTPPAACARWRRAARAARGSRRSRS